MQGRQMLHNDNAFEIFKKIFLSVANFLQEKIFSSRMNPYEDDNYSKFEEVDREEQGSEVSLTS